jgi:hypothetical protein
MKQLNTEIKWKINVKWSTLRSYHCCVRGVSTGIGVDSRGWIPGRGKMFLFSTTSRAVLGATQPPIQWVPGALSRGMKTLAINDYFYIMSQIIYRVPSFLKESRAAPGILASTCITVKWQIYYSSKRYLCFAPDVVPSSHESKCCV